MSFSKSLNVWRFAFCKCGLIECNQIITKGNIVVKIHINVATIDQFIFIIINYRHSKIQKKKNKNRKEKCRPGLVFSQPHLGSVLGRSTSIFMYLHTTIRVWWVWRETWAVAADVVAPCSSDSSSS